MLCRSPILFEPGGILAYGNQRVKDEADRTR